MHSFQLGENHTLDSNVTHSPFTFTTASTYSSTLIPTFSSLHTKGKCTIHATFHINHMQTGYQSKIILLLLQTNSYSNHYHDSFLPDIIAMPQCVCHDTCKHTSKK